MHAKLWSGPHDLLITLTARSLKQQLCPHQAQNGCFCLSCRQIEERTHPALMWFSTNSAYTLDDIMPIFERTRLQLNDNEHCYIIIEHADRLSRSTANRLLKLLEEPPHGYYFILLTHNKEHVLPTIASRCLLEQHASDTTTIHTHPLVTLFLDASERDFIAFDNILRNHPLNEQESNTIAHLLFAKITQKLHDFAHGDDMQTHRKVRYLQSAQTLLKEHLLKNPLSGSTALFWKSLFLCFPSAPKD